MTTTDRSDFLKASGALVVTFSLSFTASGAGAQSSRTQTPTGGRNALVDTWLAIEPNGNVTISIGKVELGTGIETAFAQLAADELDVPYESIRVVQGITGVTPDQGVTSGSQSIQTGSIPLRRACATAKGMLVELAAERLQLSAADLIARDGVVYPKSSDRAHGIAYGSLIGGKKTERAIDQQVRLKGPDELRIVGKSIRRREVPAKSFGGFDYVQNVRVPGMWHARVIHPPRVGASFVAYDRDSLRGIPGVTVVQKENFVAVAASREWDAVRASKALKVTWKGGELPAQRALYEIVRGGPASVKRIVQNGDVDAALTSAATKCAATYTWPFQMHASIGPSCAVADVRTESASIWSGTQGVYPLRAALAELLGMRDDAIRVTYVEAAGCYGHNGADDVAADAALVSRAIGKPVRVQWTRADEHGWEPKGPAMVIDLQGAVADGKIAAWKSDIFTPTHSQRPSGKAGNLLAGRLTGAAIPENGYSGGDRNAPHDYVVPAQRVTMHWQESAILRQSALRGLGGVANTFANESFIDELAASAGADPLSFRLAQLNDPRARDVLGAVAGLAKWQAGATKGRGLAFGRYERNGAYVAAIVDVEVVRSTGAINLRNVFVAHDCGLIVNPDGLRNQVEGNVVQAASRALKEEVRWESGAVVTLDWRSYPIVRFDELPEVQIALIDRPAEPPLGAGEATSIVIAPAIANAVFSATGVRLRSVPFTPARVKEQLR